MKKSSIVVLLLLTLFAGVASADARGVRSARSARAFELAANGFGVDRPTHAAKNGAAIPNKLVLAFKAQLQKLKAASMAWSISRVD